MTELPPFETLLSQEQGLALPLPPELEQLYGRFLIPLQQERPYVIANFVTTLDGVVSLNVPGQSGGGPISGYNQHDRMLMGLLRAVSDAVIVGAGTLRAVPRHVWTADHVFPAFATAYEELRAALGKREPPLNVIVTSSGALDLQLPVFQSQAAPVLIVTTRRGARRIGRDLPPTVDVTAVQDSGHIDAEMILEAIDSRGQAAVLLSEGGPQLIGDFFAQQLLDELFLTIAPQVAGRGEEVERPGLVAGRLFAPEQPLWGSLVSIKRAISHLFLRYAFERAAEA